MISGASSLSASAYEIALQRERSKCLGEPGDGLRPRNPGRQMTVEGPGVRALFVDWSDHPSQQPGGSRLRWSSESSWLGYTRDAKKERIRPEITPRWRGPPA